MVLENWIPSLAATAISGAKAARVNFIVDRVDRLLLKILIKGKRGRGVGSDVNVSVGGLLCG